MSREHAAGDVLDARYRLVSRLGRGGFGDVWRAEELLPDGEPFREVALKLLIAEMADALGWIEEAKMLASFRHPSLVTIYATGLFAAPRDAAGEAGPPTPYVSMELLEGETLADRIRAHRRVPWRRVLSWARDTAAALDVIHARGVVHLDLKPANLFLSRDGGLKVLDFGIARRAGGQAPAYAAARAVGTQPSMSDDASLATAQFLVANDAFAATQAIEVPSSSGSSGRTTVRAIVGTPGFMAPEVIEAAEPTAAADAYALAVVVVQLATGRLPHECPDEPTAWNDPSAVSAWLSELRVATLTGKVRDLAEDPARLPKGMVALLRRLLSVDPIHRAVTAGHLRELFDEVWERPHGVPANPYPGLAPYGAELEGLLLGRDDDTARLGRELEFEACVVLHGARRSGKTSLALAGLVPYLARRGVDGCEDWIAVHVGAGEDPDAALAAALAAIDPSLENAGVAGLAAFASERLLGLCLVVDPLESLLDSDKRARVAELLLAIVTQRPPGLRAIATLFEGRLGELLGLAPLGPALQASLRFVGPPTIAAARDMLTAPAALAGARVVAIDGVVDEIRRELRAEGGHLPFVALALRALWARGKPGDDGVVVIHGDRWKELGGVGGALSRHADEVLASLSPERRALAEEILLRLSSTSKEVVPWPAAELRGCFGEAAAEADSVLGELERQCLVARRGDELELAHAALVKSWSYLEARRMAELERWVFLERLREGALAWHRSSAAVELLWPAALLREVQKRRAWIAQALSSREKEFLAASRKRARRRSALGALALLGVLVVVLGIAAAKRASDATQAAAEAQRTAAEARAYVAEIIEKSRRTEDPYHRAAYIAEAVAKQATDGTLPLDLAMAVENLPSAEFLTLESLSSAAFHWDDRFLLAAGPGPMMTVIDFDPREGQVIDLPDLEADPKLLRRLVHPKVSSFRPSNDAVVERVPFAFDTSFVTRSASGEVRVWRVRDNGDVALAAVAPMRCAGSVQIARAAPVVACPTDDGFARWDLRQRGPGAVEHDAFPATFVELSADGASVAAMAGRKVRLLVPAEAGRRAVELEVEAPIALIRWSPRDRVLAVVGQSAIELFDADKAEPILRRETSLAPVDARWDEGGLDLAVCSTTGGAWSYLRSGARARSDPPPPPARASCKPPPRAGQPAPIEDARDVLEARELELGPHPLVGGWRLPDGRYLTRDLLLIRRVEPSASALLAFHGKDGTGAPDPHEELASATAVVRSGDDVAWQIGEDVRVYGAHDSRRIISRRGNLLERCPDGRLVAWMIDGSSYRVFDVKSDATIGVVPREPGLVLAADSICGALYTQRLDGAIVVSSFAPGVAPRTIALADGYVFDARPSAARGDVGPGLWIAASSGAIARIDERTGQVRVVAHASPHASALGDGPGPGELVYSDASGIVLVRRSGKSERVLEDAGNAWEDLAISPDGANVLLAGADKVAVLDLELREVVGRLPTEGRGRLSRWDDQGSVIAWSFGRVGGPDGDVVPRSPELVKGIAEGVSNLGVDAGRLVLRKK